MTIEENAIAATRHLVTSLGLDCTPRIIADRSNLVLALDPHPLVARVAMSTSLTRVGLEWLTREVEIAAHLDRRGVPVTLPATSIGHGPFERDGYIVSFWQREEASPVLDAAEAGARLARVHRALESFDTTRLPEWGVFHEAERMLERACTNGVLATAESTRVRDAWPIGHEIVVSSRARSASFQAVHGDAHFGNVFATTRGPLWTDWEDACVAPVEWDIATLQSRHTTFGEERDLLEPALAAYDLDYDRALADDLVIVRNLQVIVWLSVFAERQPELVERVRARLARLLIR